MELIIKLARYLRRQFPYQKPPFMFDNNVLHDIKIYIMRLPNVKKIHPVSPLNATALEGGLRGRTDLLFSKYKAVNIYKFTSEK